MRVIEVQILDGSWLSVWWRGDIAPTPAEIDAAICDDIICGVTCDRCAATVVIYRRNDHGRICLNCVARDN